MDTKYSYINFSKYIHHQYLHLLDICHFLSFFVVVFLRKWMKWATLTRYMLAQSIENLIFFRNCFFHVFSLARRRLVCVKNLKTSSKIKDGGRRLGGAPISDPRLPNHIYCWEFDSTQLPGSATPRTQFCVWQWSQWL